MTTSIKFDQIPEDWGILVPRTGRFYPVTQEDRAFLLFLREEFKSFHGKPVPYKFHIGELLKSERDLMGKLRRLWGAGLIDKFATTLHTQSGRPQYISWYIWGEIPRSISDTDVPQFFYSKETT